MDSKCSETGRTGRGDISGQMNYGMMRVAFSSLYEIR